MAVITRGQKRKLESVSKSVKSVVEDDDSSSSSDDSEEEEEEDVDLRYPPRRECPKKYNGEPFRFLTADERARYSKQVKESEGFEVEDFGDFMSFGEMITPLYDVEDDRELIGLAKLAINHFKKENKNAKLKLHRILKVNLSPGRYCDYYMTFECKDAADPDNPIKTYQALVVLDLRRFSVKFCRPKPPPRTV